MASTLRTLRRLFAAHAGGSPRTGVATSGSTKGYLEDTLLMSSIDQGDQWKESYLFRPDAVAVRDRVRQVARVDLDRGWIYPDWPEGQEYTASPWNGSAGEVYELLSPWFHPTQEIHGFLNEALRFCRVPGEVSMPIIPGAGRQNLTLFHTWLTDPSGIAQVGYLNGGENRDLLDPYGRGAQLTTGGGTTLWGNLDAIGSEVYFVPRIAQPSGGTLVATTVGSAGTGDISEVNLSVTSNWPTTYPFYITIGSELILITAKNYADPPGVYVYAATRGVGSSTPAAPAAATPVYLPATLYLRGMFPAYYLCRPSGGAFGDQSGLTLDTDEAIPDPQWVVAGALKEAWMSAPHIMEQVAETHRVANLQQATMAFGRWQEQTDRRANLRRTFRSLEVATI